MEGIKMIDPVIVSTREKVSSVVDHLSKTDYPVVVTQRNKYYGVVDLRTIQEHPSLDFTKTKVGTIAEKAPRLIVGDTIDEVIKKFYISRFKALPVVDESNNIIGMISLYEILKSLMDQNVIPKKRVAEVMTSPVVSVPIDTTIARAIVTMRVKGVRRVVVVDSKDRLKGILSIKDIVDFAKVPKDRHPILTPEKYSYKMLPIEPMVNTNVETIKPSNTIREAARVMYNKKIASLVVVEKRKPVGIITMRDILDAYLASKEVQKITISGLTGFDKNYYQDVYDMAAEYYKKFERRFDIQNLSLHIHREKYRYTVHARVRFSKKTLYVSNFAWDLTEAVFKTLESLKDVIDSLKPEELQKIRKPKPRKRKNKR